MIKNWQSLIRKITSIRYKSLFRFLAELRQKWNVACVDSLSISRKTTQFVAKIRHYINSGLYRIEVNMLSIKLRYLFSISALFIMICMFAVNQIFLYEDLVFSIIRPLYAFSILLIILVIILILLVLTLTTKLSKDLRSIAKNKQRVSKLRKRIVVAFSIGAALPTIIIAVFSTYFFNFGIENWFDQKIEKVLNQSIIVGESYIDEHALRLKETAISISDDLSSLYYDLIHTPEEFSRALNAQAELRSIDEAIIFQQSTNIIIAKTTLSFSLAFSTIPAHFIDKANQGQIVQIPSSPNKMRILIKLRDYEDTYLLIGRVIDSKIIDHIDKANGAAAQYFKIKKHITIIQIQFSLVFILISLVLLLSAIIWGTRFASHIVSPIRELVIASEKVKNGDLSVQVPVANLKRDEIRVLSSAFNLMVSQIDRQHKDLSTAQRAMAWSDVARSVAHEIKNPLTLIQLTTEQLIKKYTDEISDRTTFTKYTKNILKHSAEMKTIVSEFVEFARLPPPHYSQFEVVSMISSLVESRKLINDSINYSFHSNLSKYDFVFDVSQMNRLIVNLLLNAEESFDSVDPQNTQQHNINIDLIIQQNIVQIIITDNGPGFSAELLNSAKTAYVTTKPHGTGLGLVIVERITVDHFGELKLSNNKQGGATILLTFNALELKSRLR